jgi:site-specific recombinase XerD
MLFADMSKLYLEDHSKVNKRSYVSDCYVMRRLNETFGSKALSEITTQDVERFKGHLAQIVAPATVNRHLALLSGVFNKAVAWAKTKLNPVKAVKAFKENNERVRYLTEEEEPILRQK